MARYRVKEGQTVSLSHGFPGRGRSIVCARGGDVFDSFGLKQPFLRKLTSKGAVEEVPDETPISITMGQGVVVAAMAAKHVSPEKTT